mgnify:CR=1 FL=1
MNLSSIVKMVVLLVFVGAWRIMGLALPTIAGLFLAYGLARGAFLATEAASSLGMYVAKSFTFQRFGAMPLATFFNGLIAGASLMAGAFIAKGFVLRLKPDIFRLIMDGLMLVSGLSMLWNAAAS